MPSGHTYERALSLASVALVYIANPSFIRTRSILGYGQPGQTALPCNLTALAQHLAEQCLGNATVPVDRGFFVPSDPRGQIAASPLKGRTFARRARFVTSE